MSANRASPLATRKRKPRSVSGLLLFRPVCSIPFSGWTAASQTYGDSSRGSCPQFAGARVKLDCSNVWNYAGVNAFRAGRMDALRMHPVAKPTSLMVGAIKDCSKRGSGVLDAFLGSWTALVAAEQTGRRAFGIRPLDPARYSLHVTSRAASAPPARCGNKIRWCFFQR